MRAWLRHVVSRMAEPRTATALAVAVYSVCMLLGLMLLGVDSSSGFGWVMKLPPTMLFVASVVGVVCAWRGGYWGRSIEQLALLLAVGALVSGTVVEVYDLVVVGDTASYYVLAALVGAVLLAVARSLLLRSEHLKARVRRARVALLVS